MILNFKTFFLEKFLKNWLKLEKACSFKRDMMEQTWNFMSENLLIKK